MPITTSQSKPQRRFAPKHPIGFLRKTDRHHFGMVIGIVGIASSDPLIELSKLVCVHLPFSTRVRCPNVSDYLIVAIRAIAGGLAARLACCGFREATQQSCQRLVPFSR